MARAVGLSSRQGAPPPVVILSWADRSVIVRSPNLLSSSSTHGRFWRSMPSAVIAAGLWLGRGHCSSEIIARRGRSRRPGSAVDRADQPDPPSTSNQSSTNAIIDWAQASASAPTNSSSSISPSATGDDPQSRHLAPRHPCSKANWQANGRGHPGPIRTVRSSPAGRHDSIVGGARGHHEATSATPPTRLSNGVSRRSGKFRVSTKSGAHRRASVRQSGLHHGERCWACGLSVRRPRVPEFRHHQRRRLGKGRPRLGPIRFTLDLYGDQSRQGWRSTTASAASRHRRAAASTIPGRSSPMGGGR